MSMLEVLAPAGDEERLAAALNYGADAVYLGRKQFGMRSSPMNFEFDQLVKAVDQAHAKGVKVYLTCNTLPRNNEIQFFERFVKEAVDAKVDALIVADIGLLMLIKKYAPDMEIHISTQTGIVNYVTARELYNMGAKRVVLARELCLDEIAEIRAKTSSDLDIECFVHGAMCVSFSGRCLLSQYLVGRDANRGECAQPCRWSYHLVEEKRPNEFYPIFEDGESPIGYRLSVVTKAGLHGEGLNEELFEGWDQPLKISDKGATVVPHWLIGELYNHNGSLADVGKPFFTLPVCLGF